MLKKLNHWQSTVYHDQLLLLLLQYVIIKFFIINLSLTSLKLIMCHVTCNIIIINIQNNNYTINIDILSALCIMMYLIYHNLLIVSEKIIITDHYM